jgi:hypothetical protein
MRETFALILATACLNACASYSPDQVARPTDITLEQALIDVVTGFRSAQAAEQGTRMGISVCQLTINFNVAASATKGGKLALDATIKAPAPVNAGLTASAEQDVGSTASRGNTVSLLLTSPTCLPPNTSGAVMAANVGAPVAHVTKAAPKAAPPGNAGGGGVGGGNAGGGVAMTPDEWKKHFFPGGNELLMPPN